MNNNHIKIVLSAALLMAFTVPASMAYSSYNGGSYQSASLSTSATNLAGEVVLSQRNEKITLSLRDSDVKQVIRMLADKAAKNVVFHSSVTGKITLDLVDMPINDAFALVLQVSNLNYYMQGNTLVVLAKDSPDNAAFSKQEMMVFPVRYVSASSVASFLNKNVFGIKKAGVSAVDAATVNVATNEVIVFGMPSDAAIVRKVIEQLDKEPTSRTYAVNHTTPAEMANMICNMLLPAHGVSNSTKKSSGSSSSAPKAIKTPGIGTGGSVGIVTGGAASSSSDSSAQMEPLKLGEGIVACTINKTSEDLENTAFEAQNIAISYYPTKGVVMMVGGSEAQQIFVENFIRTNDVKQPQAFLEMSIVELNEEGSKEFQNNWALQSKAWGVSFNNGTTSGGRVGGPGESWYQYLWRGWLTDDGTPKTVQGADGTYTAPKYEEVAGYRSGAINGTYISWTMNYLIENKKARVLANPKILITNGQESVIDLTEDYVEKVTSEYMQGAAATTMNAVQKTYTIGDDKGIKITLIPFISPDGYVTMNIKPEYSTEAKSVYSTNPDGTKDIAATLLNRRNLDLKNVRIRDGETLVIGGMIHEAEAKTVQKIPVLGDLPLIGAAFRSTSTGKTKNELIIMITPKILRDGDDSVADRL